MNTSLTAVIRNKSAVLQSVDGDAAELLNVLARIVEGKDALKAFGAPGDWGYGTPIGDGLLAEMKKAPVANEGGGEKKRRTETVKLRYLWALTPLAQPWPLASREILHGVYIEFRAETIRFVACCGRCLGILLIKRDKPVEIEPWNAWIACEIIQLAAARVIADEPNLPKGNEDDVCTGRELDMEKETVTIIEGPHPLKFFVKSTALPSALNMGDGVACTSPSNYPNYRQAVPPTAEITNHGPCLVNLELAARFQAVARMLGNGPTPGVALSATGPRALVGPWVVRLPADSRFFGVIMPLRVQDDEIHVLDKAPNWPRE